MILALDTSTPRLSLALRHAGQTLYSRHVQSPKRHTETLLEEMERALAAAGKRPADLAGIAVGLGPGSFTGVRTGVAAGLGLSQALALPMIGIPSFLVIAAGCPADSVLVVEDARQEQFYAAWYGRDPEGAWAVRRPEALASADQLLHWLEEGPRLLAGPAASLLAGKLQLPAGVAVVTGEANWPDAAVLTQLADGTIASPYATKLAEGGLRPDALAPLYVRKTQAETA